ncbi:MFS transporter [Alphaproteobacteria bacterium]|nr:MFS transporter [Alphaproteobacteria bacterium]
MNRKVEKVTNPWVIWGIANVFYLYEVILRVSPSVMTNDLMVHYGITTSMLGIIISFFYYSYVVLQLPCGLILDKLGPRNLIGSSAILSVIGSILFALTDQIYVAQFGRCLVGAGASCAFISSLQIASTVFPIKHFALLSGVTNMMGTIGALCGGFPVAKSVNLIGWRETIYLLVAIGVVIAALAFLCIPKVIKIAENKGIQKSFLSIFKQVIKNKQIILAGMVGGFMYLPISVFSELWAIPFFMTKFNVNNETASFASSVLFIGFAIGGVSMALIAKKINGYVKTIQFSIISVAVLFIPMIYAENVCLSFAVVFLLGILTSAEVMVFTCAKNNESPKNAGTAIAFANGLVMLAGAVFQPILGVLLDFFWTGTISESGVRLYEISCYQKAILTLPICFVVAFVLSLFMKETIGMEKEQS